MSTKIICRVSNCIFWENKLCTSEEIIYDPDEGCLTYDVLDDLIDFDGDDWDDDDLLNDDDDDADLLLDDDLDDEKWQL